VSEQTPRILTGSLCVIRHCEAVHQNAEAISMERQYYVYIMTNPRNNVLYTGVTNNLNRRVQEHRDKTVPGFTKKYNVTKLVFAEAFSTALEAITREKQIKAGSRQKKIALIEGINPLWADLTIF